MLIKLNENTFVNKDNVTHVKVIKGMQSTKLEFHLVGGEKIYQQVNADHLDYSVNEILKPFGLN
ncbi:hypothetical protein ASC84_12395 [Acinetobacter sp. Root1280]|uniref:hypothetical protein n=1 Tax=Acinetobacter sp. Root1280 TaxID=1736444 RepID=UPI0006F3E7AD|nr:hypothetical protein [Acinetobacter sp. Root1280]KQW88171.1 hypothetical protein ASC84_12395 [Acinetobacter sp. Root1280]